MPVAARRALRAFGANIRDARRRRRLTVALLAERAMISPITVGKVERGDPTVSLGACTSVLFVLGLIDELAGIAAIQGDAVGQILASESLPQRVRLKRNPRAAPKQGAK
jgi:transcriptional regulator with XRE-family HTH domain